MKFMGGFVFGCKDKLNNNTDYKSENPEIKTAF